MSQPPTATPGWYPDPTGGTRQRYWDGAAWGPVAPGAPAPMPAVRSNAGMSTAGKAILVIGALALAGGCVAYLTADHSAPTMDEDNTYYRVTPEKAGRYLTVGPRDGQECSWGRLSQPRQTVDSIIEVGTGEPGRNTTVTLNADEYFISWGCRPWRKQ